MIHKKKSETILKNLSFLSEDKKFENLKNNSNEYYNLLARLLKTFIKNKFKLYTKIPIELQIPKITREGTKKTVFLNFEEICTKLQRDRNHILIYMSTELGTTASVQEGGSLLLKGNFYSKGIQKILYNYTNEYVLCESCKSIHTLLKKNKMNKLLFLECEFCKASRFVKDIQAGFIVSVKKKFS